jgi:hypothetical protein
MCPPASACPRTVESSPFQERLSLQHRSGASSSGIGDNPDRSQERLGFFSECGQVRRKRYRLRATASAVQAPGKVRRYRCASAGSDFAQFHKVTLPRRARKAPPRPLHASKNANCDRP